MRRQRLPGTFWTIDGYPVLMGADWTASETANLGFDQFRGQISPRSAHGLPWTVGTGSIVRGVTDDGMIVWEGAVSAPLTIEADEWVKVSAQGYAYEATKRSDRFPILVTAPEAWVVGNASPMNFPQVASAQPTVVYSATNDNAHPGTFLTNNTITLTGSLAEDISIAFWAKGARISRFGVTMLRGGGGTGRSFIYLSKGPDVFGNAVPYKGLQESALPEVIDVDVPLEDGFDALIIRWKFPTATNATCIVRFPSIRCEVRDNAIGAAAVARGIGQHLGWDTAGVQDVGDAVFPSFDWGSTAIGALSEAAGVDDLVWQVRENAGHGPRLELREWGDREWVVSGSTGAQWTLERMERYNRVTAQYLDALGQVRTTTLNADPDPLNGRAIKEAVVTLGGLVPVDTTANTPEVLAQKVLDALSPQRWRGAISAGRVYLDGRLATYECRAGDTIRISDYSKLDGPLVDRIVAVTRGSGGVALTLEPAVLAGGGLGGGGGGATPGTLLAPTNLPVYSPPGSPGSTTPITGPTPVPPQPTLPPGGGGGIFEPGPIKPGF